jgi:hypothetical protein
MFNQSKYTKWYYSITDRARSRKKEGYTEGHHIIPKCMGGDNSKSNLVRLTAREHFICHQLLVKMVSSERRSQMALAATKMWQRGNNQQRDYRYNSKTYESLKKEASAYLSELNRRRWADPEQRAKLIAAKKGPKPNNSHPHSSETLAKMRNGNRAGKKNGFYGKKHSEESRKKMSETKVKKKGLVS